MNNLYQPSTTKGPVSKRNLKATERQAKIRALKAHGIRDQREIAKLLNTSQATVSRDLRVIFEEDRGYFKQQREVFALEYLNCLDALYRDLYEVFQKADNTSAKVGALRQAREVLADRAQLMGIIRSATPALVGLEALFHETDRPTSVEEKLQKLKEIVGRIERRAGITESSAGEESEESDDEIHGDYGTPSGWVGDDKN